MRRARGPTAKRTGDRRTGRGGLGGPGGRGGRRWAIRETERELGARSPRDVRTLSARDLAAAIKDTVEHDPSSRYSPYRRAMAMVAGYADRESKRMKPEKRKKLAETKRELREMFGHAPTTYGRGGPGKKRAKRPTKSRRTSR